MFEIKPLPSRDDIDTAVRVGRSLMQKMLDDFAAEQNHKLESICKEIGFSEQTKDRFRLIRCTLVNDATHIIKDGKMIGSIYLYPEFRFIRYA